MKEVILCNIEPYQKITAELICDIYKTKNMKKDFVLYKTALIQIFEEKHEKTPSTTDIRQIQASAYASMYDSE